MKKRIYSRKEIISIRKRIRDVNSGKCFCFRLIEAWANKEITEQDYRDVKRFKIRCPLHTSGACKVCLEKIKAGGIDLFAASKQIMASDQQGELFTEFDAGEPENNHEKMFPSESLWTR